jgi:predicted TIM-barrel fold metal-dependent hydrolase
MKNGFRIVDTDAHQIEPAKIWQEYIDPVFRERAPRIQEIEGRPTMAVEGESLVSESKYPMSSPAFLQAAMQAMKRFQRAADTGYSAQARLQLLGREFRDPELLAASCAAYNDWSAQYCEAAPERLRWAAMLPLQAVDLALEEARRCAQQGCVAYYLRPGPVKGRNLYHRDYFPLWAEIEKLGRPICLHDSGSPRIPSYGDRMDTHTSGHIIAHPFEAMVAMMSLIWFGVAEHFPGLRVVHVEADAGWLPFWLQRMAQHWDFSGNAEHPDLKRHPTEYFHRSFFVAARGDEMTLPSVVELAGDRNVLFNTDYPHPDGTYPWGITSLLEQPIPEQSKHRILWDNAAQAFAL